MASDINFVILEPIMQYIHCMYMYVYTWNTIGAKGHNC